MSGALRHPRAQTQKTGNAPPGRLGRPLGSLEFRLETPDVSRLRLSRRAGGAARTRARAHRRAQARADVGHPKRVVRVTAGCPGESESARDTGSGARARPGCAHRCTRRRERARVGVRARRAGASTRLAARMRSGLPLPRRPARTKAVSGGQNKYMVVKLKAELVR